MLYISSFLLVCFIQISYIMMRRKAAALKCLSLFLINVEANAVLKTCLENIHLFFFLTWCLCTNIYHHAVHQETSFCWFLKYAFTFSHNFLIIREVYKRSENRLWWKMTEALNPHQQILLASPLSLRKMSLLRASMTYLLFSLLYALNTEYPKEMKYTFEVIQKVFLRAWHQLLLKKFSCLKNKLLQ